MPEIKHQFSGGKMNKDLDERMVPNGQYRDAMNIQVSTSDGSDVGTVQNILGNKKVPFEFIDHNGTVFALELPGDAIVVGAISDEKHDTNQPYIDQLKESLFPDGAASQRLLAEISFDFGHPS